MKRLICLIAMVAVMMGAVGFAGAEASSKSPTGRVSYKESMNLKGPVRELVLRYDERIQIWAFSSDGGLLTYRNEKVKKGVKTITLTQYDELERELVVEEIDPQTMQVTQRKKLVYDNEKKRYQGETYQIEGKGKTKLVKQHIGWLNDQLLRKEEKIVVSEGGKVQIDDEGLPVGSYQMVGWEIYQYDGKGNLIQEIMGLGQIKFEFEYDDTFSRTKMKVYARQFAFFSFQLVQEKEYFRTGQGFTRMVKEKWYKDGVFEKMTEKVFAGYEYDLQGNWTNRTVTDQDGKVEIHTRTISYWE